ncbi:hypothetical protein BaRGS_00032601, partial [Batillaria attramentaria]
MAKIPPKERTPLLRLLCSVTISNCERLMLRGVAESSKWHLRCPHCTRYFGRTKE